MRDRQAFDEYSLSNGLRVLNYPMDVPFGMLRVRIPLGHLHNTGSIIRGSAHFLEHMVLKRSQKYPDKNSFKKVVELNGGGIGARTSQFETEFILDTPELLDQKMVCDFMAQIWQPIFDESDIAIERGSIVSERKRKLWYPGADALSQYLATKWMRLEPCSLEQIFGNDEDLRMITPEYLSSIHRIYFNSRISILSGGNIDLSTVCEEFEKLPAQNHNLETTGCSIGWTQKEYHEYPTREVGRHTYYIGSISDILPDSQTEVALKFLVQLLINTTHGIFYEWLRTEMGWSYEISHQILDLPNRFGWLIQIPVHNSNQVETVRKRLPILILKAVKDEQLVKISINRMLKSHVFILQTLKSILESALDDLTKYGRVVSEAENEDTLRRCADQNLLHQIYEQYFSPAVVGEFCAIPEK